jgi:hypothetical protein
MNTGTITTLLKRLEELTWCPLNATTTTIVVS